MPKISPEARALNRKEWDKAPEIGDNYTIDDSQHLNTRDELKSHYKTNYEKLPKSVKNLSSDHFSSADKLKNYVESLSPEDQTEVMDHLEYFTKPHPTPTEFNENLDRARDLESKNKSNPKKYTEKNRKLLARYDDVKEHATKLFRTDISDMSIRRTQLMKDGLWEESSINKHTTNELYPLIPKEHVGKMYQAMKGKYSMKNHPREISQHYQFLAFLTNPNGHYTYQYTSNNGEKNTRLTTALHDIDRTEGYTRFHYTYGQDIDNATKSAEQKRRQVVDGAKAMLLGTEQSSRTLNSTKTLASPVIDHNNEEHRHLLKALETNDRIKKGQLFIPFGGSDAQRRSYQTAVNSSTNNPGNSKGYGTQPYIRNVKWSDNVREVNYEYDSSGEGTSYQQKSIKTPLFPVSSGQYVRYSDTGKNPETISIPNFSKYISKYHAGELERYQKFIDSTQEDYEEHSSKLRVGAIKRKNIVNQLSNTWRR